MSNIINKIYDNTEDGVPNYSIDLVDGTRLYFRGTRIDPLPKAGDAINFTVINTKTSKNGNQYTNIKDVSVVENHTQVNDNDNYDEYNQTDPLGGNTYKSVQPKQQTPLNNGVNKSDTQRLDIFVTGVVGRSMGSGHFSVEDIADLTKNAVSAFNENLKKL